MVILSVMNSVSMTTFERAGEFGTMRALGDPNDRIIRLLFLENLLVGLLGASLGFALGSCLGWIISEVGIPMPPPPNAESGYTASIRLVPGVVMVACLVGLTATLVATALPARRVTRLSIADALRRNV